MDEATLINRATAVLERMGLKALIMKQPRGVPQFQADAWLRVGKGNAHIDYVVEAKRTVTPATLGAAVTQLRHAADATGWPALLVTDYLTPPVAERLREQQQQFADAAGNAYWKAPACLST